MLLFLASITKSKSLQPLPGTCALLSLQCLRRLLTTITGAQKLLRAIAAGQVTAVEMRHVLLEHFKSLRTTATKFANNTELTIIKIAITYPNYLYHQERRTDFDNYMSLYLKLMEEVWPEFGVIKTISEGQSAVIYVYEVFYDPAFLADIRGRQTLFEKLRRDNGTNLIIADFRSSSLNLQVVNVYHDQAGHLALTQSSCSTG